MVQRVAIVGQPGSGKSTLALRLGEITGLPVFHMDHIHWRPGWQERDRTERVALALEILAKRAWILEGGLSIINETRAARAEVLIWLDFPLGLRVWRVLKRTIFYFGRSRPDLQRDCREGLNPEMFRFWRYIFRTRHSARKRIEASLVTAPDTLNVIRLTNPRQVSEFLSKVGRDEWSLT